MKRLLGAVLVLVVIAAVAYVFLNRTEDSAGTAPLIVGAPPDYKEALTPLPENAQVSEQLPDPAVLIKVAGGESEKRQRAARGFEHGGRQHAEAEQYRDDRGGNDFPRFPHLSIPSIPQH